MNTYALDKWLGTVLDYDERRRDALKQLRTYWGAIAAAFPLETPRSQWSLEMTRTFPTLWLGQLWQGAVRDLIRAWDKAWAELGARERKALRRAASKGGVLDLGLNLAPLDGLGACTGGQRYNRLLTGNFAYYVCLYAGKPAEARPRLEAMLTSNGYRMQ